MNPRRLAPVLVLLLAGCGPRPTPGPAPLSFPKGFLFGVSTAAEQSEGKNTTNDWYVYEGMGKVPKVGLADDMYDLYDTDAKDAASMHLNAFRFSIEWARIVPNAPADPTAPLTDADVDQAALAHYHKVVASLEAKGMTPVVTLIHYTLPKWVDDPKATYDPKTGTFSDGSLGGWTNPETAKVFAQYAAFMARSFKGEVHYWITENEPVVDVLGGYVEASMPPGYRQLDLTKKALPGGVSVSDVLQNMIDGNARAYHAIKQVDPTDQVSIAKNDIAFDVTDPTKPADVAATARMTAAYDHLFLDAVTTGDFDTSLIGKGPMVHHADWAHTVDYVGLNYYAEDYVVPLGGIFTPLDAIPCDPSTDKAAPGISEAAGCPKQRPDEAPGFTRTILDLWHRYHLPVLVTENGTIDTPTGKARYLVRNLTAVHDAIAKGATVLGYSYWTLDYDYEWGDGYAEDMGLFGVKGFAGWPAKVAAGGAPVPDATTDFTRVPHQPAVDVYGTIAATDGIPHDLTVTYGK